jgi:uncharacterized protein YjbI with pentapeptide repeats
MWHSLPTGPWSPEQMFETIRLVNVLRSERTVTRSWASQVLAEQLQRASSAQAVGQIGVGDANRYVVTLIREIEQQQRTRSRIFGRNAKLVFRGISLDGLLLQDVRLSDAYFSGCTLKGANLAESHFTECGFSECNFDGADVRGSRFSKCSFVACLFRGSLLDNTWFRRSSVTGCDFENASVRSIRGLPIREV